MLRTGIPVSVLEREEPVVIGTLIDLLAGGKSGEEADDGESDE